jgi:hypothetical protein
LEIDDPSNKAANQKEDWSLERPFYVDPGIFKLDLEKVWHQQWIFAGHGNSLEKPGDYFLLVLGNESLILIRNIGFLGGCCGCNAAYIRSLASGLAQQK